MKTSEIQDKLILSLDAEKVYINVNSNHYEITVISNKFINLDLVKRHQMVYAQIINYIKNNIIHSLSIKAYSIKEWRNNL